MSDDLAPFVPMAVEDIKTRGELQPLHKFFTKHGLKVGGIRMQREDITPSPYNPRTIDLPAQVKLRQILRKFGMCDPFIVNRLTGRLVGGHQRLKIMDQEFGKDIGYSVLVTLVELTESEEKALNIALNNDGAQGMFDWAKMGSMLQDTKDFDLELAGFDAVGLQRAMQAYVPDFDKLDLSHLFPETKDAAKNTADEIAAMKATKEEYRQQSGNSAKDGFYLQLVFGTVEEKEAFCAAVSVSPEAKIASGRAVAKELAIDIGYEYPADPGEEGEEEDAKYIGDPQAGIVGTGVEEDGVTMPNETMLAGAEGIDAEPDDAAMMSAAVAAWKRENPQAAEMVGDMPAEHIFKSWPVPEQEKWVAVVEHTNEHGEARF